MIVRTMSRMYMFAGAAILAGAALWQTPADAEQWAYAMQTGHGNHSIQVDVDSIMQRPGYVGARLLFEYYWNAANRRPRELRRVQRWWTEPSIARASASRC